MIFLNLNLLSPAKKNSNERAVHFLFIKNLLEISLFVAAVMAIALLLSWDILREDFSNLSSSAILVNQEFSGYNQEIRKINKMNRNIVNAGKTFHPVVAELMELTKISPANIKLSAISLDRSNLKLSLSGNAQRRDDLLSYQERLKQISWIDKIETPTSQLLQKENINFEFSISIKK